MRLIHYYPNSRQSALVPALRGPWAGLETELGRLFGAFAGRGSADPIPVELDEDKDNLYVRAELPGVNREAISVEAVEGVLTIAASRKQKVEGNEESYSLSRSVSLPYEVRADKAGAAYENGILTVTLPKAEAVKPLKIAVS